MNRIVFLAAVALVLPGCASISVHTEHESSTPAAPKVIYVANFATTGEFNVDRTGAELKEFKKNLQLMMTTAISTDLTSRLISSTALAGHHPQSGDNVWVIRGRFVRVNQGSRLLRGAIGFGLGATKLETQIRVYDYRQSVDEPFLTFKTSGGSNAEPGAVTAIATDPLTIAIEAVAGGAGNVAHGLTEDTKRTARETTAELSDYLYRRGWIPKEQWVAPKELDPVPLPTGL
jgi:hypothetical protein